MLDFCASSLMQGTLAKPTLDQARRLLATAGLPSGDLDESLFEYFVASYKGRSAVALGGAEVFDGVALLRSVVTHPGRRREGRATAIVRFIEQRLANAGVRDIYLLTESAAAVFAGWGYRTIGRNAAPPPIAASRQFTTLCPERAQLMHKTLATHGIPPRREGLG